MSSTSQEHSKWTIAGSDVSAQRTYASIRSALSEIEKSRSLDIFLQGSYANNTNITADSDVDIVVMTRQTFRGSYDRLSDAAKARYATIPFATYTSTELRAEVTQALIDRYGAARVHPKNKCIKVDRRDGYLDADVVPCIEYHWYRSSDANLGTDYVEGIAIDAQDGETIINFPKEHIRNGQQKNQECNGRYKATVRQVKRLENRAVSLGLLAEGEGPGYLLECMVYNTPAEQFAPSDSVRLMNVVYWMKMADKYSFMSCDNIHELFRTDPGRFEVGTAQKVLDALWEAI